KPSCSRALPRLHLPRRTASFRRADVDFFAQLQAFATLSSSLCRAMPSLQRSSTPRTCNWTRQSGRALVRLASIQTEKFTKSTRWLSAAECWSAMACPFRSFATRWAPHRGRCAQVSSRSSHEHSESRCGHNALEQLSAGSVTTYKERGGGAPYPLIVRSIALRLPMTEGGPLLLRFGRPSIFRSSTVHAVRRL